jgi:dipeptidyl aminopeptidase/acylaminoacyl peptidase
MLSALKKEKKEARLLELEGDNHHLLEGPTRQQAVEETIKFVNTYLNP